MQSISTEPEFTWRDELKSYGRMMRAAVMGRMEYRGSFIVFIVTLLGFYGAQIAVIGLMLQRFERIGGWGAGDIAFLYGLLVLAQGLTAAVTAGMIDFSEFVREGTFDRVLLRPLSPLGQILAMRFDPAGVAHLALGVAAMAVATNLLEGFVWSFQIFALLTLTVIGGALILSAIRIIIGAVAFFTVSNQGLQHLVVFSAREFLLYPVDIYNRPVRVLLTFLFPVAFINFYPAHLFLDRTTESLFHPNFIYLTIPVGIITMLVALAFWNFAVSKYSSTGN
jgi:ABC-2 type transport system permease protein